tara:strand:+ start:2468 stop:3394 length:927 start_codon:yes stop_codon:yes gene_type:complete
MINISFKYLIVTLLFFINFQNLSFSKINLEIVYKINNELVTNIDLENEKKFLIFLNPNLNNLSKEKLMDISKDSFTNRKIKEIELRNYYEIGKGDVGKLYVENFLKNTSFKTREMLKSELDKIDLEYIFFENNFLIDNLWREFVYNKFNSSVKIDIEKLRNQINTKNTEVDEINLSEILFQIKQGSNLETTAKKIYQEIDKSGFEVAASIFSISENKNFGGKIGWVKSNQISEKIYANLKNNKDISDPIKTNNGYLIIKINDKRKVNEKIDLEKELNKLILIETERELNKFGYIYFNKIKKRMFISEK